MCNKCKHPLDEHTLEGCTVIGCKCQETGAIDVAQSVNFERRIKHFSIDEQALATLLVNWRNHDTIMLPLFRDVPKDAGCLGVYYDWQYGSFVFRLWHKTWPIVPSDGNIPDCASGMSEVVTFERNADGTFIRVTRD